MVERKRIAAEWKCDNSPSEIQIMTVELKRFLILLQVEVGVAQLTVNG